MISHLTLCLSLLIGIGIQTDEAPRLESLLARPLYLTPEPPPLRALNNIVLLHAGVSQDVLRHDSKRSTQETMKLAHELVVRLREGADFSALASEYSASPNVRHGASIGAFPEGMLLPALDDFLWKAELGEISDPIETPIGIQILQRDEARAGVLHIRLKGDEAEKQIRELHARIVAGEDFGALATEYSVDESSAASGGQFSVFVRGSRDTQIKALAFQLKVGELSEPYSSPLGWHLIRRVPPDSLPAALEERTFVRARGIIVAWKGCVGAASDVTRDKARAQELVLDMEERIRAGESMERFAASDFNDDPGGRERAGDLGWVYRRNPDLPVFMSEVFRVPPQTLLDLVETSAGYVLVRRER